MATIVIIGLLAFIGYEMYIYNLFQAGHASAEETGKAEPQVSQQAAEDADIMGKSTFDVNAELKRMRRQKEEQQRKESIARGEMTEDGKEIAQPVNPEDCEVEQKKVWKQVPTEELPEIFDEPDVPLAEGNPLNDLDLTFGAKRKTLDEEDERRVSESMYKMFDDTVVLDDICNQAPEVGREICRLIDKYKKEMLSKKEPQNPDKENVMQRRFSMADRYMDFTADDLV